MRFPWSWDRRLGVGWTDASLGCSLVGGIWVLWFCIEPSSLLRNLEGGAWLASERELGRTEVSPLGRRVLGLERNCEESLVEYDGLSDDEGFNVCGSRVAWLEVGRTEASSLGRTVPGLVRNCEEGFVEDDGLVDEEGLPEHGSLVAAFVVLVLESVVTVRLDGRAGFSLDVGNFVALELEEWFLLGPAMVFD